MKSRPRRRPQRATQAPPALSPSISTAIFTTAAGLARHEGQAVFVAGALQGERVEARWSKRQARFSEARTQQVLSASAERVEPRCRHYGQCGGCQLQHASPAHQLTIKQNAVLDQLSRAGVAPVRQLLAPVTSEPWHYRARARLAVVFDKAGRLSFGFRRQGDKQLVNVQQCPVLPQALQDLLAPLRTWLQSYSVKAVSHVELIQAQGQVGVVLRHTRPIKPAFRKALADLAQECQCQVWLSPDNRQLTDLNGDAADPRLILPLEGLELAFHPLDFTQVNPAVNRAMVAQALQLLAPQAGEHVLDLFCGIGNFTLPLAEVAGRVTGIEAVEAMVARGRENAARCQLDNIDFMACDLERYRLTSLEKRIGPIDAVLLDPPRAGAAEACRQLPQTRARHILYVSCNPATLARDARILTEGGFVPDRLGIMEMFPHTAHTETMVLFTRG